ncbi:MAG TPA: hypothetical protein VNV82_25695 [Bryobacteraceae bacterium]|nr:hypothetical protein [Bryobacteraceae bacterium]
MFLAPAIYLRSCEVLSPIGAGMGEVHRATDTTLGHDVTLKILPEVVAQDAEQMPRSVLAVFFGKH